MNFQFISIFVAIIVIAGAFASDPTSAIWIVPFVVLFGLGSVIFYAFKIANFFKSVNSLNAGGGQQAADAFKSMKIALILDVVLSFFIPVLTIFTKIFFWVMYRSKK